MTARVSVAMVTWGSLLVACVGASPETSPSTTVSPISIPPPTTAKPTTTTAREVAEHAIGVRTTTSGGELYVRATGERFVPRGANLVRLEGGHHSTLDVGLYDPQRIELTFASMAVAGYNTVRIFLNSFRGGLPGQDEPLSSAYLDNSVDVLRLAQANGLQVLFTQDWLPEGPDWAFDTDPMIENVNSMYFSVGGLEANRRFFMEWASGLVERGAALDALLGYELRNELYFTEIAPPFSLASGSVTTANGQTYDLSSSDEKRRLLEDNLVYWIDRMREAIVEVDPTALVTVGFFQPKGPNTSRVGDDRLIETREAILRSSADFIDLHGYPGGELDLSEIVENFGLPPVTDKPILLGEFGTERGAYPTVDDAIRALVGWQMESCAYGFDGWLLWTWDSNEQPEFWNGQDEEGAIAAALSPSSRPDPCSIGELDLAVELSGSATPTASASLDDSPAGNAIDGLPDTLWNAGDDAPQWIEVDLGTERTVEAIRLLVAQYPPGDTEHRVSVRGEAGQAEVVSTLSGPTKDGTWLVIGFDPPRPGVRYIRIETIASPSWAAWREISILGRE